MEYNDFEGEVELSTSAPKQSKIAKRLIANRPLEAEKPTTSRPLIAPIPQSQVERSTAEVSTALAAEVKAEQDATPFADAFKASVGGYTRDLYERVARGAVSEEKDPTWDVGKVREQFRTTYGMDKWQAAEDTVNKAQYDALVKNLDSNAATEAIQGKSAWGTMAGVVLDPLTWAAAGGSLKAFQLAGRAYQLGKYGSLAGGAVAESALVGGAEVAKQVSDVGYVYDKESVAYTVAFTGALHFGIGAATVPKAAYDAIAPTTLAERFEPVIEGAFPSAYRAGDRVEPFISDEARQAGEFKALSYAHGGELITKARKDLAEFAQVKADEFAAGKRLAEPEIKLPPQAALPKPVAPKPEPTEEGAMVNAGSAVNEARLDLDNNIIMSNAESINYIQESSFIADKAQRELVGQAKYDWLHSPSAAVSVLFSNTLQGLKSKSHVVRHHALILGEDSTGIFTKVRSGAAIDRSRVNSRIRHDHSKVYDEYKGWLKRTGKGGWFAAQLGRHEEEFNALVRNEMEARWNSTDLGKDKYDVEDLARWEAVDPEVKRAADALDAGFQTALDLAKEAGVQGTENLPALSRGYMPRRVSGDKLRNLYSGGNKAEYTKVQEAFGRRYFEAFKTMQARIIAEINADGTLTKAMRKAELAKVKPITLEKSQTIANGVLEKAIDRSAGVDGTTVGLLDRAARDEIKNILQSKQMDYAEIEHTFELLDKRLGSKSGSNRFKGRMDIDIITPEAESGIKLIDYFDNDINRLTSSYTEEMSGRIALSKHGIKSDNDFENIIQAAKNSHTGSSDEVKKDITLMREMHSFMLGRQIDGQGMSKFVQLMTGLNPLQTLGQVGAAQGAESSLHTARLGLGSAIKAIPMLGMILVGARKNMLSDRQKSLLRGIERLNGPVGEDWRIRRPRTETMERLLANGEISQTVDRMLKAGQVVNGFVSFMHQIMESQLKMVAVEGSATFAKEIQAGVLTKRIADAGFSEGSMKALKREIDTYAEFKDGELWDLHLDKWAVENSEHFAQNIERLSGQLIQKDFVGETASWMHKDNGRMFMSLRGYAIKAYNKQLVRNVYLHDATAAASLMYGLAFSSLAYTAKMYATSLFREDQDQFLEDRLSGDALLFGAIGYVSLASGVTDLLRTGASWNAEAGEAGAIRSGGNAVTAIIPGLNPLARVAEDITNVAKAALSEDVDFSARKTRHLLQTTLGNNFALAIAINAAIDDSE